MKWVVAWEDKTGHLKPECKRHGRLKKKKKNDADELEQV